MKNLNTQLQRLGIGELRVLGRLVGSPGPTTMARGELIESILALAEGKAEPMTTETGPVKGKPPRERVPDAKLGALAEEIKTMISLNRPFRLQIEQSSLIRLSRSDTLFSALIAPEEERVRTGYIFRAESETWFLFDAKFLPVMTLSDRDAEWKKFRSGTYLSVTLRDGEADVWGIDGFSAESYAYPLAWKPMRGRAVRRRTMILRGKACDLGSKILYRGELPADEIAEYLAGGIGRVAVGLHFGLSAPQKVSQCDFCIVKTTDDVEKIDFQAARAARLAERGHDVLMILTGLQDTQDETLMRKKLFPVVGTGAADGTVTLLAIAEFPLNAAGFEEFP